MIKVAKTVTIHQVSPQSNFWFGIHTALKSAPLKHYRVTHDDVIKLRLHRYVAIMKEIMYTILRQLTLFLVTLIGIIFLTGPLPDLYYVIVKHKKVYIST